MPQEQCIESHAPLTLARGSSRPAAIPPEPGAGFRNATRLQQSLTASLERKVLLWLAPRLPHWITSDHLTLLGFVSMILAGGSYWLARWHPAGLLAASLFLALNWFGDSLDGTVARVRNRQRPRYGFYVDHMIDSIGALFLIAGLAGSSYIDARIAAALLIGFLLLSVESYLASYTLGVFRLSFGRFGPTELRLLLVLANVSLWLNPNLKLLWLPWRLFDVGGAIGIAGMVVAVIVAAVFHTRRLYRQETV